MKENGCRKNGAYFLFVLMRIFRFAGKEDDGGTEIFGGLLMKKCKHGCKLRCKQDEIYGKTNSKPNVSTIEIELEKEKRKKEKTAAGPRERVSRYSPKVSKNRLVMNGLNGIRLFITGALRG